MKICGIKVCKRWMEFKHFLADMGERPDGTSLDRINNDGNYEPSNCRWATAKNQGCNRRDNRPLTHNGQTKTLSEWSEIYGLNYTTIRERLNRGWSVEDALSVPVKGG